VIFTASVSDAEHKNKPMRAKFIFFILFPFLVLVNNPPSTKDFGSFFPFISVFLARSTLSNRNHSMLWGLFSMVLADWDCFYVWGGAIESKEMSGFLRNIHDRAGICPLEAFLGDLYELSLFAFFCDSGKSYLVFSSCNIVGFLGGFLGFDIRRVLFTMENSLGRQEESGEGKEIG